MTGLQDHDLVEAAGRSEDAAASANWASAARAAVGRGAFDEAIVAARKALCLDPGNAAIMGLLDRSILASGAESRSADVLRRAIVANPADMRLHFNLARGLWTANHHDLAERSVMRALILKPVNAKAIELMGVVLRMTGRSMAYLANQRKVLTIARYEAGSFDASRRHLCLHPSDAAIANEFGAMVVAAGQTVKGVHWFRRALTVRPMSSPIYSNLGNALDTLGRLEEARRAHRRACVASPHLVSSTFNFAVVERRAGAFASAERGYRRALCAEPGKAESIRFNLSLILLATGQVKEGLRYYEDRWWSLGPSGGSDRLLGADPSFPQPLWNPLTEPSADLLVWGEQGLGDEIWGAGYLNDLRDRSGATVIEIEPRLVSLMARSFPWAVVVPRRGRGLPETRVPERQVPLGSLPHLATSNRLTAPTGYLTPDPARCTRLRQTLRSRHPGLWIGLSWRSVKPARDRSFEIPLEVLAPLLNIPDLWFLPIQYGASDDDLETLRRLSGGRMLSVNGAEVYRDMETLAAMISEVDAVVSIANVTVAMAHAVGKNTLALLRPVQEDWRYQHGTPRTPWFPRATLIRSDRWDDWSDVSRRAAAAMAQAVHRRRAAGG